MTLTLDRSFPYSNLSEVQYCMAKTSMPVKFYENLLSCYSDDKQYVSKVLYHVYMLIEKY